MCPHMELWFDVMRNIEQYLTYTQTCNMRGYANLSFHMFTLWTEHQNTRDLLQNSAMTLDI